MRAGTLSPQPSAHRGTSSYDGSLFFFRSCVRKRVDTLTDQPKPSKYVRLAMFKFAHSYLCCGWLTTRAEAHNL
eukprot:COSAG02_NODE_645_length_18947_cov_517.858712_8_plen_74_part_00